MRLTTVSLSASASPLSHSHSLSLSSLQRGVAWLQYVWPACTHVRMRRKMAAFVGFLS